MKLSVPCHFSKDDLSKLSDFNRQFDKNQVAECYGSINPSLFGSGRISETLPYVSAEEFIKIVEYSKENNLGFNYTLNQACMGGDEFSKDGQKKILKMIEFLELCGVKSVTVAIPSLIDLISSHFSNLEICASAILRIDSIDKAKKMEDLGAKRLILFEDLNRNFNVISKIKSSISANLEVMVNSPCLFSCAYREYHYTIQGHKKSEQSLEADKWFLRCNLEKLKYPDTLIKARGLIRPEDLHYYEDAGVDYIKIVGRESCISNILEVAYSYLSEQYDGNLFDLLPKREGTKQAFFMDNRDMDNFIEFFVKEKNRCMMGCVDCSYCTTYASKMIPQISADKLNKQKNIIYEKIQG